MERYKYIKKKFDLDFAFKGMVYKAIFECDDFFVVVFLHISGGSTC